MIRSICIALFLLTNTSLWSQDSGLLGVSAGILYEKGFLFRKLYLENHNFTPGIQARVEYVIDKPNMSYAFSIGFIQNKLIHSRGPLKFATDFPNNTVSYVRNQIRLKSLSLGFMAEKTLFELKDRWVFKAALGVESNMIVSFSDYGYVQYGTGEDKEITDLDNHFNKVNIFPLLALTPTFKIDRNNSIALVFQGKLAILKDDFMYEYNTANRLSLGLSICYRKRIL